MVAFGIVNQYYWYRMRAEIGAGEHALASSLTSPRGIPATLSTSRGRPYSSPPRTTGAAQKFLAFLVGKQGQQIIGDPSKSISFEYPIGSGVSTEAPETPFAELRPFPISIAELGDGSQAIALLKQAGLL